MTLSYRVAAYARAFPDRPPMHVTAGRGDQGEPREWLEGTWIIGNNFKGEGYYGEYPRGYLDRVAALFPDLVGAVPTLHCFSGSLGPDVRIPGVRVDINPAVRPACAADARRLPFPDATFAFLLADTPYGPTHAQRYGYPMPDRATVFRELARVARPGAWLVWLDTKHPMFRKDQWMWVGTVLVIRSTNHDLRGAAVFRRVRDQLPLPLPETP